MSILNSKAKAASVVRGMKNANWETPSAELKTETEEPEHGKGPAMAPRVGNKFRKVPKG